MIKTGANDLRSRFSRLSTAIKMFVILGVALFPLGLVAVLASVDAARDGRAERELSARAVAAESARALDTLIARDTLALRIAASGASLPVGNGGACALMAAAERRSPKLVLGRYAFFNGNGNRLCASPGFAPAPAVPPLRADETRVWLDAAASVLRYGVRVDEILALAELDRAALRTVIGAPRDRSIDVQLADADNSLQLVDQYRRGPLQRTIVARDRLDASNVFAGASVGAIPISAAEIVSILLPLIMWLAAALLGWLIVDRLLLRPIVRMQQAVLAYRPGGKTLAIPDELTPATEIRDLGQAFVRVTHTVAAHEAELGAAIERQARLVREVHHRVKNNLQVVASLLNLHARGARSVDAADAYASIQRRVDALSVVHRNHYAELEDDRGVALRTLLSELTANLRGTAPDAAAGMAITLDLDTVHVNQDVAVSVAFFVTEVVEHAMLCTPDDPVGVSLNRSGAQTARLRLTSASLRAGVECEASDTRQFERIMTGLSRQLRAVLERDTETGAFAIDIAVQAADAHAA